MTYKTRLIIYFCGLTPHRRLSISSHNASMFLRYANATARLRPHAHGQNRCAETHILSLGSTVFQIVLAMVPFPCGNMWTRTKALDASSSGNVMSVPWFHWLRHPQFFQNSQKLPFPSLFLRCYHTTHVSVYPSYIRLQLPLNLHIDVWTRSEDKSGGESEKLHHVWCKWWKARSARQMKKERKVLATVWTADQTGRETGI